MNQAPPVLRVGDEPPPLTAMNRTTPSPERMTAAKTPKTPRFPVINGFVDFSLKDLRGADIAVWLVLWRDTKRDGIARTSQADLAKRAGLNERTVRRALKKLTKAGLVDVVHRGGVSYGPSRYRVHAFGPPRMEGPHAW